MRADRALVGRAAHGARHPSRHGVADTAADTPCERQPQLIGDHDRLAFRPELRAVLARARIADVHADHALDELRILHRELIAVEAAPVVQEKRHAFAGTSTRRNRADDFDHFVQRIRTSVVGTLESREREPDAAVARFQRFDLLVPQPVRVGPAVDHDDRLRTRPLGDQFHVVDSYYCGSSPTFFTSAAYLASSVRNAACACSVVVTRIVFPCFAMASLTAASLNAATMAP